MISAIDFAFALLILMITNVGNTIIICRGLDRIITKLDRIESMTTETSHESRS